MGFIQGIAYNFRGLLLGIKTPRLLFWGLLRFLIVILITFIAAGLILVHTRDIMGLIWAKPASYWVLWLWHLASWLLSLCLVGLSTIISYLISQVLFSVLIMDHMSRITEKILCNKALEPASASIFRSFVFLVGQEIPRAIVPVLLTLFVMLLGWLTPLGPLVTVASSAMAAIFLAWDNTDLIPARQLVPFRTRIKTLLTTLPFHLGFGLPLLIPGLNILLLSFGPVGAAMYKVEQRSGVREGVGSPP